MCVCGGGGWREKERDGEGGESVEYELTRCGGGSVSVCAQGALGVVQECESCGGR